ncbi:SDR family NAD(P)-dependent oxidoreductase [Aliikangiella coralliicola]|nr:SDR family NAD(P)-dependent oxidoreductase [Aliikangiella coralliicola]
MFENNRKIAVITGASSGFGRASVIKFVANGWNVIALARRAEKLSELQQEVGEQYCYVKQLDVCEQQQIDEFAQFLDQQGISIDLLVNNAGLALGLESADKALHDDWQVMVDTNIKGLIFMTRALLPQMVEKKKGHIINLGSIAGTYAYPGGNTYGASKAFVAQFSLNLRADLAGTGIRVTNIEPGLAETEFSVVRFHGDQEKADSIYQGLEPLSAEDIAESIFWSASLPSHVNINRIEIMPTCQSFSPLNISR